jgi:hypothetical protein
MKAIDLFGDLEKSILHIIGAADLYAIQLLARSRKEEPDTELVQSILEGKRVSSLTVLGAPYTEAERKELEESGILRGIGNQIVLATYTALESYLKNKFKEYFHFRFRGVDVETVAKVLERLKFSFRSLDEIAKLYKDILDIHLPCFEIDMYFIGSSSSFSPKGTWEGIKAIEKARHDIAHEGKAKHYKIGILPDAWEPFDLVRRWVELFDANFDYLVYKDRPTPSIQEYQRRVAIVKENARVQS